MRLLKYQWEKGGVPNDERKIAALLHTSMQRARSIWSTVSREFLSCDDGLLRCPRLSGVRVNDTAKREDLADRGRNGAGVRYGRSYDYGDSQGDSRSHGHGNGSSSGSGGSSPSESSLKGPLNPAIGRLTSAGDAPDPDFDAFWLAYPRKVGKLNAHKAWRQTKRLRPPLAAILGRLDALRSSPQWTRDGGQYVPHPGTWLRRGGWEDEPEGSLNGSTRPAPQASRIPVAAPADDVERRRRLARAVD